MWFERTGFEVVHLVCEAEQEAFLIKWVNFKTMRDQMILNQSNHVLALLVAKGRQVSRCSGDEFGHLFLLFLRTFIGLEVPLPLLVTRLEVVVQGLNCVEHLMSENTTGSIPSPASTVPYSKATLTVDAHKIVAVCHEIVIPQLCLHEGTLGFHVRKELVAAERQESCCIRQTSVVTNDTCVETAVVPFEPNRVKGFVIDIRWG